MFSVFFYELLYPIDLISVETPAILKPDGVKPEFGLIIVTLNVNVRRLVSIARVKEESIGTNSQYSWHYCPLLLL